MDLLGKRRAFVLLVVVEGNAPTTLPPRALSVIVMEERGDKGSAVAIFVGPRRRWSSAPLIQSG